MPNLSLRDALLLDPIGAGRELFADPDDHEDEDEVEPVLEREIPPYIPPPGPRQPDPAAEMDSRLLFNVRQDYSGSKDPQVAAWLSRMSEQAVPTKLKAGFRRGQCRVRSH